MAVDFFIKKRWAYILLALILLFCFGYAIVLNRAKRVYLGKSFYFLVCESDHVEADTLDIRLDGGAGYPFLANGKTAVALAVYLKEEEGLSVQTGLIEQGKQASLVKRGIEHVYFKKYVDKKNTSVYISALENLYGFLQVLSGEIVRLDKGATQESSKRILQTLSDLFAYHHRDYERSYPAYADLCNLAKEELKTCMGDTVFVNDLRYLLCELSVGYLELAEEFSL